ncbi:MAG: hypothetical protein LBV41_02480 [Cytophagaceae bacterium]|jgi:hypothetical protein|nr:hypothetical protein [Cytophagaceae bacterium]
MCVSILFSEEVYTKSTTRTTFAALSTEKYNSLQQPPDTPENTNLEKGGARRTLKVTTDVSMLLLQKSGKAPSQTAYGSSLELLPYVTATYYRM